MASLGEARVLRSFGVHVAGQAASAGCLVLVFVLLCSGVGQCPSSILVLGNLAAVGACAAFGGTVVLLCELAQGSQAALAEAVTAATAAFVAGLPLAAVAPLVAGLRGERVTQVFAAQTVMTVIAGWCCAAAVPTWSSGPLWIPLLAYACLTGAVVMWMASSPQPAMIRANT